MFDAVDSERKLAKVHQVSLMTARHALACLEREGIVQRRRGEGTFVAPPRIHFNKLMSYTEQMASRGLAAGSKVIASKIIANEDEIAGRLNLTAASRIIKIERLRHTANGPFASETCYLPADEFPGLVRGPLGRGSLFATLELEHGVQLYADEEVDATAADARLAELLEVSRGSPVLRMRQVIYSSQGKPVVYVSDSTVLNGICCSYAASADVPSDVRVDQREPPGFSVPLRSPGTARGGVR